MTNHRLRSVLLSRDLRTADLAAEVGVDPKSVERWIVQDRLPHARTRFRVAQVLEHEETYLWPQLLGTEVVVGSSTAELVQLWPTRDSVPGDVWRSLIDAATQRIDVLVYAGGFLVESFRLIEAVKRVSEAGGKVRLLLGDPAHPTLKQRGIDEGLPSLPGRASSTWEYLSPVHGLPGVELRTHGTPLYVSIYRFDEQLLTNPHTHGVPAKDSPLFRFQSVTGGQMVPYYDAAFERVWQVANN